MNHSFDTLIIGAGSVGMAAGYFLSRAGQRVLLLDAGDPPHDAGAHHGSTRLIRHAYGEGAGYVPLALRAQQLWLDLEQQTGTPIFAPTGVLNIGDADEPFITEVQRGAALNGLRLDLLDGATASKRWPAWRLDAHQVVCHEPDAGVLFCEEAVRGYRRLATQAGAVVRPHTTIAHIEADDTHVVAVTSQGERYDARHAIVCAARSSHALLRELGIVTPVTRLRKTFAWFDADSSRFGQTAFPGFSMSSELGQFYGFPDLENAGLKVGRHDGGQILDADASIAPFGAYAEDADDLQRFVARYLPDAGALRVGKTCQYIMTPDSDFIVDRLPGHPNLHVATGFSGHGFKFASALGEALSECVIDGASRADLSLFSLARFTDA